MIRFPAAFHESGAGRERALTTSNRPSLSGAGRNAGGFTYLGLMFLIAASGIALVAVSQVWYTAQKRDKEEQLLFAGDQIRLAIGHYYASTPGKAQRYPSNMQDLLRDPRFPGVRRHLRRLYRDPMVDNGEWGLMKAADGTIIGVYSLSEQEPLKKSGFSREDRNFEGKAKYSDWMFLHKAGPGIVRGRSKYL